MTESQRLFFDRLNRLSRGERASLKREAGRMLRDADSAALTTFYHCLPPAVDIRQEEKWYAVSCLRCLWDTDVAGGKPIEQIISSLIRSGDLSESTSHRIQLLLDTKWDKDGYMLTKLARLVKLIRQKSDQKCIDFCSLLDDLIYWNSDSQSVQRKWARAIFADKETIEEKE